MIWAAFLLATQSHAQGWTSPTPWTAPLEDADLVYANRTAVKTTDGRQVSLHLLLFHSRSYRLAVIDLGDGPQPRYATLPDAFRSAGLVAGVNGGFFHPNWRPAGLMIADGRRINRLETAKLLSGVLYSDAEGNHLVRRARFRDHPGITALLQTGPYLVEAGQAVRGLSTSNPARRTFVATDWRGHWALGVTVNPLTLADLAQLLASPEALVPWPIDRAINLDGGSSSGFYFDPGSGRSAINVQPWKRVRNLIGIKPR
ncbi:hypothetical protein CKO25_12070 [Thiocapsa imhoffii]|uniref:Phosphodiester glycosidase domain-containing protein n=1 Tax=Thiocapsa imhoffii TaxID=382777 RepID=A0A9X1B9R7_9GAMM|nr:phosphodiester glycosidase family protein [Thiocapsa imhoffii]MBK1645365.1 hypothetical protein [Thiocapsa imhoffii]